MSSVCIYKSLLKYLCVTFFYASNTYERGVTAPRRRGGGGGGRGERHIYGKRPIQRKIHQCTWKETYICGKRPIYMERDLYTCKETYNRD